MRLGFREGDSKMTVSDPSNFHSLVRDIEEIGTLVLGRQRGTPEHPGAEMENARGQDTSL